MRVRFGSPVARRLLARLGMILCVVGCMSIAALGQAEDKPTTKPENTAKAKDTLKAEEAPKVKDATNSKDTPNAETTAKPADEAKPKTPAVPFAARFEAFAKEDAANPPKPGKVLFIGSSSIVLWNLKKSFPDIETVNRGFGGSQTHQVLEQAEKLVVPHKPRKIVYYCGDNDIGAKKTPQQVFDNFKAFHTLIQEKLPKTPIIFISIKPSVKRWHLIDKVREANGLIKKYCEEHPELTYFDTEPLLLNAEGKPDPGLLKEDGLHMNEKGYERWNKALRPLIEARGDNSAKSAEISSEKTAQPRRERELIGK